MSNALAIAAVTATLRRLIEKGLEAEGAGIAVLARPPDRAGQANGQPNRVNLFLYQATVNAAWRNMNLPHQARAGETAQPPLPLDLFYLLTAYAEGDDEVRSHRFLGRAMSVLHDHPLLGAAEIKSALEESELHDQIERIRFTLQPLSVDEISKLWSGFQTQYRLSVAYQASVVLIESTRPGRMALPVLKRGEEDRGVFSTAAPFATLAEARPPKPFTAARLGDDVALAGDQLDQSDVTARLRSARLTDPIAIDVVPGDRPGELKIHLPDASAAGAAAFAPGFYTVSLVAKRPTGPIWTTNEIALALAPVMTVAATSPGPGDVSLTITCRPRLRDGQRVSIIVGDRQVAPKDVTTPAAPAQPTTVKADVTGLSAGKHVVRLRVDGVDSIPLAPVTPDAPLKMEFDPNQMVTVA
jgi:Pvc16 N-terminal domain